ncbi:MAG: FG-GAP-like repeat-containing protein [Planctomycetaceae bacterium]
MWRIEPFRLVFRYLSAAAFSLCLLAMAGCRHDETVKGPDKPDSPDQAFTAEQYQQAMSARSRGIAHLENKEWADAERVLTELADLLPNHRLALRNLAVARVLALVDRESPYKRTGSAADVQAFADAVDRAAQAVDALELQCSETDDQAVAKLLRGRLLIHQDDPQKSTTEVGLEALHAAADLKPEAADLQFAVAMAMDGHRDYADAASPKSASLLRSLQKSFDLAPENLFALQKLMQRQALFLNSPVPETREQALKITDTLNAAVRLLVPLNESIKKQRRLDLTDTITKALAGFDGSNPATLMGPAMMTGNLLLPELATQLDQRRLSKNLLEYLVLEFDSPWLEAARTAGAFPDAVPNVVQGFSVAEGLPDVTGVTDFEFQDLNQDGFDDLVIAADGRLHVYSRGGVDGSWELLMSSPENSAAIEHFLLADLDRDFDRVISDIKNPSLLLDRDGDRKIVTDPAGKHRWFDADLDVVGWSDQGIVILQNNTDESGKRRLEEVVQQESVERVVTAVVADLEADGDLDLIIGTQTGMSLWQNTDGTHFTSMNSTATLPTSGILSLAIGDWNGDLAMDVLGVTSDGQLGVLDNMLHGRFRWMNLTDVPPSSSLIIADLRGNSSWQAVTIHDAGAQWTSASDSPTGSGSQQIVADGQSIRDLQLADLDHNGWPDLVAAGTSGLQIAWNTGQPGSSLFKTEETKTSAAKAATLVRATDLDDDGDLDLVSVGESSGSLAAFRNEGGNTSQWIDVVARAVPDDPQFPSNRVNMHAIGSVLEVRSDGFHQTQIINQPRMHLGLGDKTRLDAIRILWTDGIPQNVTVPELLKSRIGILAPQILKGSCPYIYTWTGERFEFFSDCLWAAPLGLVQATGEIAPTREWEHLLIPGEALADHNGSYRLQLTEELWEVAYFDQVQLTAIDHPEDVSIFTNEKVGPPSLAEHRIYTVRNARVPVSVTDGRGRDLKAGLAAADGDYVQAFRGRRLQGLTDEWVMEFDLGELKDVSSLRLFLTGWVFPTDTSLNLHIEQNPQLAPPAAPAIDIPDGQGGWTCVTPFIGFPSGKTKAMVVDLMDVHRAAEASGQAGSFRFRLRSTMELYWDQAFFTLNETDEETRIHRCPLTAADLHYRGFSHRIHADHSLFRNGHAPESYDYSSLSTEARWSPILGRFTRYGEASELLTGHDDRMVVMGPGDELSVQFDVPSTAVPGGWKRDFVLMNVGYDKDADLNTIYGQSSEPFPFRSMSRYPFAADESPPDLPEYQEYLDTWQTREYRR